MNIDSLKTKEKDFVNDFFDMLVASRFVPRITLPTRISNASATLKDNFMCKLTNKSENSIAGILLSALSDHFPYFISLTHSRSAKRTDKYIEVKQNSPVSLNNYKNAVAASDIYSQINKDINANPNINYNIVHNILKTPTEEHLAPKIVKSKKQRHRKTKWITQGIIKSISFRDKLYKEYRKSPMNTFTHERLKTNLNTYNKISKSNILLAKRKHYHSIFEKYKHNIKNTWTNIKDLLQQSKVKRDFPNNLLINGDEITDANNIANKFCEYFTNIGPILAKNINMPKNIRLKIS